MPSFGVLEHDVVGIVDEVHVVAGSAEHDVDADAADEQIAAGVAVEHVVLAVAVALQIGAALQDQVLHVRREPHVGGREHGVVALAHILRRNVAGIVGEEDVVAQAAVHQVGADTAVEQIVSGIAGELVGIGVAVALQVGAAEQHQVFKVRPEPVMDRRIHHVGAFAHILDHHVVDAVDDIHVIAQAADQSVIA